MKLQGLHHITMITGEAQQNAEFYADVLGLRLVKKTVNFDQPEAYHLYFGDERGAPGSILTWFEFPGAARGRAGAGMIHTIQLGVGSDSALEFWEQRLNAKGYRSERGESAEGSAIAGPALRFEDYDGLHFELVVAEARRPEGGVGNPPLRAEHPEIPAEHAILGIEGARAYSAYASVEEKMLTDTLGFRHEGGGEYRLQGDERHFHWAYDPAPDTHGIQGAGTVHHIAWASPDADHLAWQQRVHEAGGYVTDVRDRDYFKSIYFREPRGVLFEIATLSPGFAVDEDPDHLGEELRLPQMHAHLREHLERKLRPVVNPRAARRTAVGS
jgi:glyoxalase family protein